MDPRSVVHTLLTKRRGRLGVKRVPFWFGSRKSSGIDILAAIRDRDFSFENIDYTKLIKLIVNPNHVELTPSIRIAQASTGAGRVYYNWVNERGSAIEAYEISMKGTTGNLLPGTSDSQVKLYTWMRFREMTLEPRRIKVVIEENKEEGKLVEIDVINNAFILARTIGLPTTIIFVGYYKSPIVFTESSENQYSHDWEFTFAITDMFPRYEELSLSAVFDIVPEATDRVLGS